MQLSHCMTSLEVRFHAAFTIVIKCFITNFFSFAIVFNVENWWFPFKILFILVQNIHDCKLTWSLFTMLNVDCDIYVVVYLKRDAHPPGSVMNYA